MAPRLLAFITASCVAAAAAAVPDTRVTARDADVATPIASATTTLASLAATLKVGDVVFIRVPAKPFREVAAATGSWTNHVGVVVSVANGEVLIGESKFPRSRLTALADFVARSEGQRIAVTRLVDGLTDEQRATVLAAASKRVGVFYDTGFDLHAKSRQFCSRYVREVLFEASGQQVGEVQTFAKLLARRPDTQLGFWKRWYFGSIPWQRETVTPASVLHTPGLQAVFDGVAT